MEWPAGVWDDARVLADRCIAHSCAVERMAIDGPVDGDKSVRVAMAVRAMLFPRSNGDPRLCREFRAVERYVSDTLMRDLIGHDRSTFAATCCGGVFGGGATRHAAEGRA